MVASKGFGHRTLLAMLHDNGCDHPDVCISTYVEVLTSGKADDPLITQLSCFIGRAIINSCLTGVVIVTRLVDPLDYGSSIGKTVCGVVPVYIVSVQPEPDPGE